jgi:hypothetical protein
MAFACRARLGQSPSIPWSSTLSYDYGCIDKSDVRYQRFFTRFLDVHAYEGLGWQRTGFLDTEVYQNVMSQYLDMPPASKHPRHTLFGLIYGECLRHIQKSSSFESSYIKIALLFYQRLRARGFSLALLANALSKVPSYHIRDDILTQALAPPSMAVASNSPVLVFAAVFSRSNITAGLPRAIF